MSRGATELPLAGWARELQPSAIQDALQRILRPGVLSLALGLPAAELFPSEGLAEAAARVFAEQPRQSLQYGASLMPLRQKVVELMALRGVRCSPEQVFLTSGAQQGMSLLALDYLLLNQPMQRRFLSDPYFKASELLLCERIPKVASPLQPHAAEVSAARRPPPFAKRHATNGSASGTTGRARAPIPSQRPAATGP